MVGSKRCSHSWTKPSRSYQGSATATSSTRRTGTVSSSQVAVAISDAPSAQVIVRATVADASARVDRDLSRAQLRTGCARTSRGGPMRRSVLAVALLAAAGLLPDSTALAAVAAVTAGTAT